MTPQDNPSMAMWGLRKKKKPCYACKPHSSTLLLIDIAKEEFSFGTWSHGVSKENLEIWWNVATANQSVEHVDK